MSLETCLRRSPLLHQRFACAVWVGLGGLLLIAAASRADSPASQPGPPPPPSQAERIDHAIESAKAYLYKTQREGKWEEVPKPIEAENYSVQGPQWGGLTALATYALLASGENAQSPRLVPAVQFLVKADLIGTYAVACRAQVWALLPQPLKPEYRAAMLKDADFLLRGMHAGSGRGFYHYLRSDEGYDHSTSQYGVLGMWACAQAGFDPPARYWQEVESAWVRDQLKTGGWDYDPADESRLTTASMTAAGVATLFITQEFLHADAGVECRGNISSPSIEAGLKWMSDHVAKITPDSTQGRYFYTLYGLERIGVASGRKYFGSIDWFSDFADRVVQYQQPDGSFNGTVEDTAFALLFLVRGRAGGDEQAGVQDRADGRP